MTVLIRATARTGGVEVSWFARLETYLFTVFVGGLALTPVWLGGNRLISWGIHAALFCGLLILLEAGVSASRRRHTVGVTYLRTPAILIGVTVIWILVQTIGFVPDSWKHPIWSIAAAALEKPLSGSISVNPQLTILALVRLLTAVAVFWLALQLCRDAKRANTLLASLAIVGFIYAAYGILAMAITPNAILWLKKDAYVGFVTATFVNRNSFASFAGVTLLAAIGATLRLVRRQMDRDSTNWRLTLARAIEATGKRGVFLLAMIFTIVVALLLSGSRGGITSTALGIFVLASLAIARAERGRGGQIGTILTACAVILGAFLAYGDLFVGRLDSLSLDAGGRQAAYSIVLGSIRDAPMLGFGYGTFQDVFPMYRDASVGLMGTWDKAHNTYLEIFQGLGLVFGATFLSAIGLLIWRCVQASVVRRQASTVPIVAAAASVLLGAHAFVDFSLQIQSITLIWSALLGAGVAQSWSSRKELDVV